MSKKVITEKAVQQKEEKVIEEKEEKTTEEKVETVVEEKAIEVQEKGDEKPAIKPKNVTKTTKKSGQT